MASIYCGVAASSPASAMKDVMKKPAPAAPALAMKKIMKKPRTKPSKLIGGPSTAMKKDEETSIGGAIGGPIDGHEEDQAEADMPNVQEDPASQEVPTFPEEGDHGASSSQVPSSIFPAAHALLRLTSKDCTHSCTPTVDRIFKEQNMPDSG